MSAFASRYARAFADVVIAQHLDPNQVVSQLNEFVRLVESSPELKNVWQSPGVPTDQKVKLLDAIVARENSMKYVRNFIAVLIQHHQVRIGGYSAVYRRGLNACRSGALPLTDRTQIDPPKNLA